MNIGSATQSNPTSTTLRQPAGVERKPPEREPDRDRDDKVADLGGIVLMRCVLLG